MVNKKFNIRIENIILFTLILIYSAFSIYLSVDKAIWRDEAFTILIANQNILDIIKSTANDSNPPLFYVLLHIWQIFTGSSPILDRLLTLLFSLLTIITVYFSAPKILDINSKLFKSILLVTLFINGSIFFYSYELRPYSFMMFLSYLVAYLGYKYISTTPNKKTAIFLIISSVSLVYTQTLGIIWFSLVGIGLTFILIKQKKWQLLKNIILIWSFIGLLYLPWSIALITQYNNYLNSHWLKFNPNDITAPISALFTYNEGLWNLNYSVFTETKKSLALLFLAIILLGLSHKGFTRFITSLVLITILIVYIVSFKTPLFYGRYVVFLAPMISIILSISIYKFIAFSTKDKLLKISTFSIAIFLICIYLIPTSIYWLNFTKGITLVNYKILEKELVDNFYARNELDIMPCMIYQKNCYLVTEGKELKRYVGFTQLQNRPTKNNWYEVDGKKIGLISQKNSLNRIKEILSEKNYEIINQKFLGHNTYMTILEKSTEYK